MMPAVILFGLAALGGATMVVMRLSGKDRPPAWMALGHGAIGIAGIVFLFMTDDPRAMTDMARLAQFLFAFVAVGGVGVFVGWHIRHHPLPIPLILGHGLLALVAFALLLTSMFRAS